ncbi:MAG: recombination protein RmuC [Bryobacterales bacterium]|nr:recombination protein RmuC [Bryobacterales bacterium]
MTLLIPFLIICLFGSVAWAVFQWGEARRWRYAAAEAREQNEDQRLQLDEAKQAALESRIESEKSREVAEVQLRLLTQTQKQLEERFRALASDALHSNSQLFLDRSKEQLQHLVEPVGESLKRFEQQVKAIEVSRVGAYEGLTAQVGALTQLQERVRQSTDQLKTALRSPIQRGRWGEMQLRRVVELAGMLEYCDFAEQETFFGEKTQRPDLVVRLPNHCKVVVDSKVSLEAYLRAIEAQEEAERTRCLVDHARQVRTHVKSLGEKAYWQQLPCSPEFVVAFLPLESLFSAALEHDAGLLDFGVERRVMLATPTTLITLLLTVAHGWRQQAIVENVDKIRETGRDLYKRLLTAHEHFGRLGDAIEKTVATYNQTVGSMERNVLPSARKFKELHPANTPDLEEVGTIEMPRRLDGSKWLVNS